MPPVQTREKKRTCLCFDASCRPRENEKKDKRWMLLKLHTRFVFVWAAWLCAGFEASANVRKGERGLERRELQPGSFGVLEKETHASSIKKIVYAIGCKECAEEKMVKPWRGIMRHCAH